jgi:hypothetical protein
VHRVVSQLGVNVAGAVPFEESGALAMGLDKSACVNQSQKLLDDGQIGSNRICLVSGLARPVPHAPLKIKTTPESSELEARLVARLIQIS